MSQGDFWSALEELCGEIEPARREALAENRLFRQARDRFATQTETALELARQVVDAYERGAEEGLEQRLARPLRLKPPQWWLERHRLVLERLRPLQQEAWRLFGLDGPIPPDLVPRHVKRLGHGVKKAGLEEMLAYPTGDADEAWGSCWVGESEQPYEVLAVHSGLDETDCELLMASAPTSLPDPDNETMHYQAGSPLYRLARLEAMVCYAALQPRASVNFELRASAAMFLLCDVLPPAPWIEMQIHSLGPEVVTLMAEGEAYLALPEGQAMPSWLSIEVPAIDVPAKYVAAAYAAAVKLTGHAERPRTSPKSEWPSRLVLFVLAYRREHPRATWAQMYEAWQNAHPGVYGSLQSFRNTYNRVARRSGMRGQ